MPTDVPQPSDAPSRASSLPVLARLRLRFLVWRIWEARTRQDHQNLLRLTRAWSALYEKVRLASAEPLPADQARMLYCDRVRRMAPAITREERRIVSAVTAARCARKAQKMNAYARAIGVEEAARARLARLWSHL